MGMTPSDAETQSMSDEVREYGYPFIESEPFRDEEFRAKITQEITQAAVIGLGEASHGTREIFEAKAELIKSLIRNDGLRLVCLEASFAAVLEINEYVLGNTAGDEMPLPHKYIHHPLNVESVRDLIRWIAEFNRDRPLESKVRVHGVDVQLAKPVISMVRQICEADGVGIPPELASAFDRLEEAPPDTSDAELLDEHLEARTEVASELQTLVEEQESQRQSRGTFTNPTLVGRLIWSLEQGFDQLTALHSDTEADPYSVRDQAMADQLRWLREYESTEMVVFWGHNAHVGKDGLTVPGSPDADRVPSVGTNLDADPEIEYYAIGMLVGGGDVLSMYIPEDEPRSYEMESPAAGSVPAVLNSLAQRGCFIPISALPTTSELCEFLTEEQTTIQVLGGYTETPVQEITETVGAQYDGLVHFAETTAARPLET